MKRFEYKKLLIPSNNDFTVDIMEDEINKLGERGWELVSQTGNLMIFKREIITDDLSSDENKQLLLD